MGCVWARWLRRCQNSPHTADKSDSSPVESFHNKGRGTGPLVVTFETLFRLEQEARPGSSSGFLSRLL